MTGRLSVVMYHYVLPLGGSAYPLKGVDLCRFRDQVRDIRRRYYPVSIGDVVEATAGGAPLPGNALLLTFDDGLADHYRLVLPILLEAKVPAAFFPPAAPVLERRLLDVHKIHFILAREPDTERLLRRIDLAISEARLEFALSEPEVYRAEHWRPGRLDGPAVAYVKRLLQHVLPAALRARIASKLFREYVTGDEPAFADELYLTLHQLRVMHRSGMEIGGHGHEHMWMDRLTPADQAREIDRSIACLAQVRGGVAAFVFAYPYGAHNGDTIRLLRERGCAMAFTTRAEIADLQQHDLLTLPRVGPSSL